MYGKGHKDISAMGTLDVYLCYTQKIMEYAGHFLWKSVLKYDQAFRHKQANGQLRWRDDNQHLVTVHLVSPVYKGTPPSHNRTEEPGNQPGSPRFQYAVCTTNKQAVHTLG